MAINILPRSRLEEAFGLVGKRAIVTGAGSGLAESIAKTLAMAGASVVVAHDDIAQAERVVSEIAANGDTARAAMCDVTDEASIIALMADEEEPDIVVLGAMQQGGVPAVDMSAAQWDAMFAINTRGAFLTAREAIKRMVAAGRGGRIIALSTIGSQRPMLRGNAAYGSSKAALNQLCRNLAFEHAADGIRVNAILPGAFPTNAPRMPGAEDFAPSGPGLTMTRHLSGMGEPADMGWLAVYLASPAAQYITGQSFVIDGGFQVG
ncbi:3-oxoacyl-ACP reductase FabG [Sphingomonas oligophenolica]|uniref:SDR family NAD(P)-dependent oxidoreductase n=1 Tax=Sphingomonas oligophenolica TaxID=301154 RepID=A0ABU9YA51_9SPHN